MTGRIGIVCAGIAGLACAQRLRGTGKIVLLDKGRRHGGRLTTVSIGKSSWDLGAPSLTPFDPHFRAEVKRWQDAGWVARWDDGPADAVVGIPSMAALVAEQSRQLDVRFDFRVQSLSREENGWMIEGEGCQADESDIDWGALAIRRTIGITAGASTPDAATDSVVAAVAERLQIRSLHALDGPVEPEIFALPERFQYQE